MAKIVIYETPEWSSLLASLGLARELKKKGHSVEYLGLLPPFDLVAKNVDVPVYVLGRHVLPELAEKGLFSYNDPEIRGAAFLKYYLPSALADAKEYLARNRPDLALVSSFDSQYTSYPFIEAGVPIVVLRPSLDNYFSLDRSPVYWAHIPPRVGRKMFNLFAWIYSAIYLGIRSFPWWMALTFAGEANRKYWIKIKKMGGGRRWGEYGWCINASELLLAPKELDLPWNAEKSNRYYAGPCVDLKRPEIEQYIATGEPPFDWGKINSDRSIVYCAFGTMSSNYPHLKRLCEKLIRIYRERPSEILILQIGARGNLSPFGKLPENIIVRKIAPQLQLLKKATVFITHGGLGSIREAAYFGVPCLVLACKTDQFGNGARIDYHGIGLSYNISTITIKKLAHAIAYLQKSESVQSACKKMKTALQEKCPYSDAIQYIALKLKG